MGVIDGILSGLADLDPDYRAAQDARRKASLFPGVMEHQALANRSITEMLADLGRERAEKAQAPAAIEALYRHAAPQSPTLTWGEEEGAGMTPQGGRPAARTLEELMKRGAQPVDIERGATYLPKAFGAMGLLAPEEAEKKRIEGEQLRRLQEIEGRYRGTDVTKDPATAYRMAAEMALAKRDLPSLLKAVSRSDDPVAIIERIRGAMTGEGGPNAAEDRLDWKVTPETWEVKSKAPSQPTQGAAYIKAVDDLQALEEKYGALDEKGNGHPEVVKAARRVDRLKSYPVPEGGTIIGGGSRTPIAQGNPKPLPEAVVQDIRGIAGLQSAVTGVDKVLDSLAVEQYIGPLAQYWSTLQRATPGQMAGEIPPEVVDLEQNLARITNYTIKLITGAQMSEREADRIRKELPSQGNQPKEFRQKWETTKRNIAQMARTTANLALRGDARAKAVADELGLKIEGAGGATTKGAAPPAGAMLSRGSETYKRAKARGMSDAEIEAVAGAKLSD